MKTKRRMRKKKKKQKFEMKIDEIITFCIDTQKAAVLEKSLLPMIAFLFFLFCVSL